MDDCDFEWIGPFWGGDPDALELHVCIEYGDHGHTHRCACGETTGSGTRA